MPDGQPFRLAQRNADSDWASTHRSSAAKGSVEFPLVDSDGNERSRGHASNGMRMPGACCFVERIGNGGAP